MKKALITGIAGQDGSYLAELLFEKGYEVHGIVRRVAFEDPIHKLYRIQHLLGRLQLHSCSIDNYTSIFAIIAQVKPDECYHLAAQSFVSYSFEDEFSVIDVNTRGTHYLLSAIKKIVPQCRFYFAGSSEMFGKVTQSPQSENTPFCPRSPYGISKLAGFHLTRNYRESYHLHASSGILFNHESPRRGFEYVTRKITMAAARIKLGLEKKIQLGNLEAKRDWGYSQEYVRGMWLMLQQDKPDDYVLATGECHSVRECLELAFSYINLDPYQYLQIDETFFRPSENHPLVGDASKAKEILGWENKIPFKDLIKEMVDSDIQFNMKRRINESNSIFS